MKSVMVIGERRIGVGQPVFIVAEVSANHNQSLDRALEIVRAAKRAGADAVKFQTYRPDTITLDCDNDFFQIKGTPWAGRRLFDLYGEAYTPWEWHPRLRDEARALGLDWFSTPFDPTAVDFLESLQAPAYKIASFELVDIPLIRRVARTGKPIILSTGMSTYEEIAEAVQAVKAEGNETLVLLKCTSAYPASPEDMNLSTIPDLSLRSGVPVGLSDHTRGTSVAVAATALGAVLIEKHLTLSRDEGGPDSEFSLEPQEFREMADAVRSAQKALGKVKYGCSEREEKSRAFRRSLFVVCDMNAGEAFTPENVRSIRPAYGLHPRHWDEVMGRPAATYIQRGTPLEWSLVADSADVPPTAHS